MHLVPPRPPQTYSPEEVKNIQDFVAFASDRWAGSKTELARRAKISQPMVSALVGGTRGMGSRSLRAIADATGVTLEDIPSGLALLTLRARLDRSADSDNEVNRLRAARALAELFAMPVTETMAAFDEIGAYLPANLPATAWFDIERAAIERRSSGYQLAPVDPSRSLPPRR